MNLAEAQEKLNSLPQPGIISGEERDRIVTTFQSRVEHEGVYAIAIYFRGRWTSFDLKTRKMDYKGWSLNVWTSHNQLVEWLVKPGDDLAVIVAEMVAVANKICPHKKTTWLRTSGRCLNDYRCEDCGAVFSIDSSD
jgi:hypothetical protein